MGFEKLDVLRPRPTRTGELCSFCRRGTLHQADQKDMLKQVHDDGLINDEIPLYKCDTCGRKIKGFSEV